MYPTPQKSLYHLLGLSITISITLMPCFLCSSQHEPHYTSCSQPFRCGDPSVLGDLKYPFWGINRGIYCGQPGFEIKCINDKPIITASSYDLQLIGADPKKQTVTVMPPIFWNSLCPPLMFNNKFTSLFITALNSATFYLGNNNSISFLTILYGCPSDLERQLSWLGQYSCSIKDSIIDVHFATHTVNMSLATRCLRVVVLPLPQQTALALKSSSITLTDALNQGFELDYFGVGNITCDNCVQSGGECGFNSTLDAFSCYCPDQPYPEECSYSKRGHKLKSSIAIGASIGVVALLSLLGGYLLILQKCKRDPQNRSEVQATTLALLTLLGSCLLYIHQKCKPTPQNRSVEDSLKNYASLVPKRYTYKYIKKMSNSFREKLGEGGYGTVFKGSFKDGRVVAIKVWKQSKGDGQDFINEVMSISRTSHVNVVPLLGFCFEGHKRALIYEFMPNGSLEKFIHGRYFNENNQPLSAQKLFEIGVGIARGLEYLHRGCNTRIVHFDIKPHNILLDAEFTPKISDFGLAKLMKQKESIISMSGARGTAGYIAPEVFFRTYGGVSHKSDVYSFGMMVLEMVGCKNRRNDNSENSSEMYFPQWIYKQLEQEASIVDCERILNEEEELERKMIVVGLWCIQTNPSSRPSMSRVVEMLEGRLELLEVPPMPVLCSPPRQQQPTDDDDSATVLSSSTTYAPAMKC